MDHTKILKRAWHILWSYKVLWIFGIILALTTAGVGNAGGGSSYSVGSGNFQDRQFRDITPDDFRREFDDGLDDFGRELENAFEDFEDFFGEGIRSSTVDTIIAIGIGLLIFFLILFIVGRIARYVSETALIKMVDQYEETEERLTFRKGLRLGWSRTAWRLFLINLVVNLPVVIVFGFLFILAIVPLFLWGTGVTSIGVVGTVGAIGLFFIWVLAAIAVSAILNLLKHFFARACAIEGLGVFESIRRGFMVVRGNLKDVGLMWLIMLGISIGWSIVMIPIFLLAGLLALLVGGAAFFIFAGLGSLIASGATPWIIAGVLVLPIFALLFLAPLGFVEGLRKTFVSSTWTLTYREATTLERLDPEQLVEVEQKSEDDAKEDDSEEEAEE
jgi:hypothetical protein